MPPKNPSDGFFVSGRPSRTDYQALTPRTPHSRSGRAEEGITEVGLDAVHEDEVDDYRTRLQQQSEPLLAGSGDSGTFPPGYRSKGDDEDSRSVTYWLRNALSRPAFIAGSLLAICLLVVTGISIAKPGALEQAVLDSSVNVTQSLSAQAELTSGSHTSLSQSNLEAVVSSSLSSSPPTPSPSSSMPMAPDMQAKISYENYTTFPLTGNQYRYECAVVMGRMKFHPDYWDDMGGMAGPQDVPHGDDPSVCKKTLTYLLDGSVGLTADLALIAQAAALAREVRGYVL